MSRWNRPALQGGHMKPARLLCLLAMTFVAMAQDTLTNESVVKMVKSGLGENLIMSMIQGQPGKYSLNPDGLVKLKEAGISEKILAAMAAKGAGATNGGSGTTFP